MALTITGLSKTYAGGVRALHNVSLEIPPGMFGLLGPNGAGKTTLMRSVATLQLPDTGAIRFGSIDVLTHPEALRQVLGYLPQEFGLYPNLSAERILDHFTLLKGVGDRGERRDMVAALLQQTNLYEARRKRVGTFSGGMKQRLGIAIALAGNPKLIIVDEPTAGLDPNERQRFLNLLAEIGDDVVVILSTHIVDDVRDLCKRLAIIDRGEVVLHGDTLAVLGELRGRVWRKPVRRDELAAAQRAHTLMSVRRIAGDPVIHVYQDHAPDASFAATEPTLDDVYFRTLGARGAAPAAV